MSKLTSSPRWIPRRPYAIGKSTSKSAAQARVLASLIIQSSSRQQVLRAGYAERQHSKGVARRTRGDVDVQFVRNSRDASLVLCGQLCDVVLSSHARPKVGLSRQEMRGSK